MKRAWPRPKAQGKPRLKSARKNQAPPRFNGANGAPSRQRSRAEPSRGGRGEANPSGRAGKEKTGARRANAPKMRGSRIEEQKHRRANGLRTALCLSAAKTGATGAVALRRANDAARGKGEKTSRQTHADSNPKQRAPVTPAQEPRKRGRRLGAQHPPSRAQQRCGAAALVYILLHDVWAAARTHPPGRNLSFHVWLPGLGHISHDQFPL